MLTLLPRVSNLIGASALFVFGCISGILASGYNIGTLSHMGPGLFPLASGMAIGILSILVALFDRHDDREKEGFSIIQMAIVLLSMAIFALMVRSVGFIPATFAAVFVASLAMPPVRPLVSFANAAITTIVSYFGFVVFLGLPVKALVF